MCFFLLEGLKLNYRAFLAPKYKWHYCIISNPAGLVIVKFCRFYSMVELPMAALPCVGNMKILWGSVHSKVSRSVPALFLQVLYQDCGESLAIESFIQVLGRKQGEQQWPVSLRGDLLLLHCPKRRLPNSGIWIFVSLRYLGGSNITKVS